MPLPLRAIAWLVLILGVCGLLLNAWAWWSTGSIKISRLLTAALYTWSGNSLRRGDREGLDYLLGTHGLLLAGLIYAVITGEPFTPVLVGAAIWIVTIGGFLAYCRLYLPWREDYEPGSYQDWLTNPDYRDAAAAFFEYRDLVLAEDRKHPPAASELIDELVADDEDESITLARLQQLAELPGQRQAVVAAVADALDAGTWRERPQSVGELLELVPEPIPTAWADRLFPLLDELPEDQRYVVWIRYAEALAPESVDTLVEGLSDSGSDLWILQGLIRALRDGRGSAATRRQLKPALLHALDDPSTAEEAVRALILVEPEELARLLTTNVEWNHRARMLAMASALEAGLAIDPACLLALFGAARKERAWGWVARLVPWVDIEDDELFGLHDELVLQRKKAESPSAGRAILAELVRRGAPGVEARIRATITRYEAGVSEAAAGLLCKLRGLPEYPRVDYERELPLDARYYSSVEWLTAFANNGGLIKAIDQLNAQNMAAVLPALDAMGLPQMADLWRRAASLFGVADFPSDEAVRRELVAAEFPALEEELDVLTNEYFDIEHVVDTKLAVFAAEHADEIRPVLEPDDQSEPWSDFSVSDPDDPE